MRRSVGCNDFSPPVEVGLGACRSAAGDEQPFAYLMEPAGPKRLVSPLQRDHLPHELIRLR
jgi:hypothetical protein